MGIYISGVKGLPEQVQENKENIKDIQEEIEGIDWDAIHDLENQVAENTQDINNMEGTIGTQNIAITQLGGRVDGLEDKTQDISRQGSMLYIDTGEVVLNADLCFESDASNNIVLNNDLDTKIVSINNSSAFIGFDSTDVFFISSDGAEYEFSNDKIYVNGAPIISQTTKYIHHLVFVSGFDANMTATIINTSNTPFTQATLATYLYNSELRSNYHMVEITGCDRTTGYFFIGIYSSSANQVSGFGYSMVDSVFSSGINMGIFTLHDTVTVLN